MTFKHHIVGERIYLREVLASDVTENYRHWLNDPEINQYLEVRFVPQTLGAIAAYVDKMSKDKDNVFLAIVHKEGNRHIGNLKIGPINRAHRYADIGIVIGEKDLWGKGYATEAIALATRYGFESLGLHRLEAGAYTQNAGSAKAFLKAGWHEEGVEKSKWLLDGRYTDGVRVGCVNPKENQGSEK